MTDRTTNEPDSYAFTGEITDEYEASAAVDVTIDSEPASLGS